eukprot:SAG31_NODE_3632_length_4047_cov_1.708207_3_plen_90_part_00
MDRLTEWLSVSIASGMADGKVFNVVAPEFGAVGDGVHNDTAAIRKALAAAAAAGGGIVLLPAPHTFLSGSLHMQNHTVFRVEVGVSSLI